MRRSGESADRSEGRGAGHHDNGRRGREGQVYPSRYDNGSGSVGSRYGGSSSNSSNSSRGNGNGNGPRHGHGHGNGSAPRYGSSRRNDYGPVLARDLDSTYEEKLNRNYANSIFVGNLTYDCTPEDLRSHFGAVGEVVRADIITSRGHHRGMGTVEYTNPSDVDEAIRRYDSSSFMDRPIFVRQDNPPPESRRERPERNERNERNGPAPQGYEVLIRNLPYEINWQALKDLFKECGTVLRADVDIDNRRRSMGTGRVSMATKADYDAAMKMYSDYDIGGRLLRLRPGRQPSPEAAEEATAATTSSNSAKSSPSAFSAEGYSAGGERSRFVYCSNLPETTDRNDLYDLFETIGSLNNAELRVDSEGGPTGIAVVEYADINDADMCIERLDNYNYGDCDLHISYAKR